MMLIVVPPKRIDLLLRVLERRKPVHVQTFVPKPSVERFNRRVVGRLPAAAEVENDVVQRQVGDEAFEFGVFVAKLPHSRASLGDIPPYAFFQR